MCTPSTYCAGCTCDFNIDTWHCRLAHINIDSVLRLDRKEMVSGMTITGERTHDGDLCKPCLDRKQHCNPIPDMLNVESQRVLHRTYSDVCGPMETTACTGHRYFVTYIDAHSHHLVFLVSRSAGFSAPSIKNSSILPLAIDSQIPW